jgi:hypothetical protein
VGGRDAREARTLGLWTASWLGVLLVAGLLWVGNLPVQWPVLLVPALWALVALRPRRTERRRLHERRERPAPGRTDTVERPALRVRPDRPGGGR